MARKYDVSPPLVTLRKEAPPVVSGGGKASLAERYADELEKVKADPGEWYAVLDYGERTSGASSARLALTKRCPGFEFVARNGVLYARFTGEA